MSSCTIDVCSITVSPSSWQGIPGESFVAYATVYPSNATDQRITWVTDKASIATVTADGLVVAQGRGTTRISAVARDGSMVYGSCTVTVTPKINVTSVGLSIHALTLNPNSCCVLKAEVCPANASSRKLIWSSSDNNVATVTDGKVWALRAGTAYITAMANDGTGQKDTCRITVKRDTVLVSSVSVCPSSRHVARGESFFVSAAVSPEGAEDRSVRWSSSNTNIATVNSSGLVYAQGIGTACITAVANDESGYSDSCFVKVSTTIPVSSMVLDIHQRTLNPDTFVVVSAIVCPENASDRSICWTSSNTRVATVEKGKVRAVGPGTATITATTKDGSDLTDSCTITVKGDTVLASSVSVSTPSRQMAPGETFTAAATVCPTDADDRSVRWSSSNTCVATVNPSSGLVTALEDGTAIITARAADGSGKKDSFTVTVSRTIPVSSVSLNISSRTLNPGTSVNLCAAVSPSNASNQSVYWESSNVIVAPVDPRGQVSAASAGTAVITAHVDGKSASCTITVRNQPLTQGIFITPLSLQLDLTANTSTMVSATVIPIGAPDRGITWTSSNTNIATVNPTSGLVMAQGVGTATITATANDGSGKTASCCVSVWNFDITGHNTDGLLENRKLLMLNTLIYLGGIWGENHPEYVNDAVNHFLAAGVLDRIIEKEGALPCEMEKSEWVNFLNLLKGNADLMSLRIDHPVQTTSGMRAATFVDDNNNAYVVFRGTGSDNEWYDNGRGGHMSDTESQKEALKYVQDTLGYYDNGIYVGDRNKPYRSLTVSGHSKGGNKAQYVAITAGFVDKCVSFDGQGFSMEFLAKYKDAILKRSDIITSIASEFDFVNCLFYSLPIPVENRLYLKAPYLPVNQFLKYHSPIVLMDGSGWFYKKEDASLVTKLLNAVSIFACSVLKGSVRENAMRDVMSAFVSEEYKESRNPLDAGVVLIRAMLPYLAGYSQLASASLLLEKISNGQLPTNDVISTAARDFNMAALIELKSALTSDDGNERRDMLLLTSIMNAMPGSITFGDQIEILGYLAENILDALGDLANSIGETLHNWIANCAEKIYQANQCS